MTGSDSKRLLIVANPSAGRGRAKSVVAEVEAALCSRGWAVEVFLNHPQTLRATDVSDLRAIIVVGGDGTLRCTVDRAMKLVDPPLLPPVLVVGLGTANLMQRHLKLQYQRKTLAADVVRLVEAGRSRSIDAAVANDSLFLLMAGCGLDASVVHQLDKVRRGPITRLSYVVPGVAALRSFPFWPVTVTVDGRSVCTRTPAIVFVGNVAEYGTGFPILDRAVSDDRLLDICVFPCSSWDALARLAMMTAIGQQRDLPGLIYTTGTRITIDADASAPLQIDGDPAGHTPVDIRLLDSPVRFIVP